MKRNKFQEALDRRGKNTSLSRSKSFSKDGFFKYEANLSKEFVSKVRKKMVECIDNKDWSACQFAIDMISKEIYPEGKYYSNGSGTVSADVFGMILEGLIRGHKKEDFEVIKSMLGRLDISSGDLNYQGEIGMKQFSIKGESKEFSISHESMTVVDAVFTSKMMPKSPKLSVVTEMVIKEFTNKLGQKTEVLRAGYIGESDDEVALSIDFTGKLSENEVMSILKSSKEFIRLYENSFKDESKEFSESAFKDKWKDVEYFNAPKDDKTATEVKNQIESYLKAKESDDIFMIVSEEHYDVDFEAILKLLKNKKVVYEEKSKHSMYSVIIGELKGEKVVIAEASDFGYLAEMFSKKEIKSLPKSKEFSVGQTLKEFADLVALISDKDNADEIFQNIKKLDSKKAASLEKSISALYKRLFNLA